MKTNKLLPAITLSFVTLAFACSFVTEARAELSNEDVQEEAIVSESSAFEPEMVSRPMARKKVIVREEEDLPLEQETVITPSQSRSKAKANSNAQNWSASENANAQKNQSENGNSQRQDAALFAPQTVVVEQAHANAQDANQGQGQGQGQQNSFGARMDQGMQNKMDGLKSQYEDALLRQLDKIKITVDDGSKTDVTVVQDQVVNTSAAAQSGAGYMSIDQAPQYKEEPSDGEAKSVAKEEKKDGSMLSSVRLAPIFGITNMNSDVYNIDNKYTAGIQIEVDVSDNLAAVLGYSYAQYDVALGNANPFFGMGQQNLYGSNQSSLQYNQNLFEIGGRFYLFPRDSKFRVFVGGGLGYNKGYLNYRKNVFSTYAYNPYQNNLQDYEVTSYLGIMETGAELSVSKNVAIGANFKYANVLSSSENQPLNNYGFAMNGYGQNVSQDQRIVGGSIAEDSFYSILGTVKVSF